MEGKVIIFSAPSGSGKSTIVHYLLTQFPQLEFSISATSRKPRGVEKDGVDYYFLSSEEFADHVAKDDFLEWEEVYAGTCYGTFNSEVRRIWSNGHVIIFDVDVKGGLNIKKLFGDKALSMFIMPPSVEELRVRLIGRGTDTPETIEKRISKAEFEMSFAQEFDVIVVNDKLEVAQQEAREIIANFLAK